MPILANIHYGEWREREVERLNDLPLPDRRSM
jgi:hypothetical protein